ncbi:MAG: peptidoglycan-binding protein [Acidimicrobiia bacterium]|nr:peptidoglycan-binding protein [Acidimicrobiia bacterium]
MPDAPPVAARRSGLAGLALAAALALVVATAPGAAAAGHYYGEMVDYPLVFPVIGDVHYADWFYAQRADGEHHAQDLMGTKMLPIVAASSGRIEYVNWSSNPNDLRPHKCCSLTLRHDDGWQTYYIHLNNDTPGTDDGQGWGIAPGIRPGVHVQAGELIGWMGDSGNAEGTSPHLHFELRDPTGVIVNPYEALRRAEGQAPPATCSGGSSTPLDSLLDGTRLLRKGSRGADVGELQGFLNLRGHEAGPVDRIFGSMTDLAVRAFQRERGLNADGVVGAQTRTAVRRIAEGSAFASLTDPNGRILRPGEARGEDVRLLQEWLRVLGYDAGPFDGIYGPKTAEAVSAFQTAAGLRADGKVGPRTREALAEALGIMALPSCG